MKRFLPFLLTAALLCALCAPAMAVDNPAFSVKVTGTLDPNVKWNGQDSLVLDWQIMANQAGLTLNNTQGLRLAYDNTVLQLMKWNGSGVIDDAGVKTSLEVALAAEERGVYPYNVAAFIARDNSGRLGYLSLALGSSYSIYTCPQDTYVTLEKVRLAFRAGKSAADLTAGSIRIMNAAELHATNQSTAVLISVYGGTSYTYGEQSGGVPKGSDTLNRPDIGYPGSDAAPQDPDDPAGPGPDDPGDSDDLPGQDTPGDPPDGPDAGFTNPYIDVKETAWYYPAVKFTTENGLMTGTAPDRFSPDGSMTRAMFATVLHRMAGKPETAGGESPFDDVPGGQWYSDAILWAYEQEIITGYGNNRFGPNDSVTREQIVTILWRYSDRQGLDVSGQADLSQFTDAGDISSWALPAMRWAVHNEVMSGRSPTSLAPRANMTRAEVAQILLNFSSLR